MPGRRSASCRPCLLVVMLWWALSTRGTMCLLMDTAWRLGAMLRGAPDGPVLDSNRRRSSAVSAECWSAAGSWGARPILQHTQRMSCLAWEAAFLEPVVAAGPFQQQRTPPSPHVLLDARCKIDQAACCKRPTSSIAQRNAPALAAQLAWCTQLCAQALTPACRQAGTSAELWMRCRPSCQEELRSWCPGLRSLAGQ